jgi:hypothetical protein
MRIRRLDGRLSSRADFYVGLVVLSTVLIAVLSGLALILR